MIPKVKQKQLGELKASHIIYDNTIVSGLTATDVQDAIDEVSATAQKYETFTEDTGDPNGFIDPENVVDTFDNGTRTLTLTPNTSYTFYSVGNKFIKTEAESIIIDDIEGDWYIYYDENGILQKTQTFLEDIILKYCVVAFIHWDAVNKKQIYWGREQFHTTKMGSKTHQREHLTTGFKLQSGGALGDIITDGNGSLDSHIQFSNERSLVWDEDAFFDLSARIPTANIGVYYKLGPELSTVWRIKEDTSFPVFIEVGNTQPSYNRFNTVSGEWELTELTDTNNTYMLVHVALNNDTDRKFCVFLGQAQYAGIAAAREAARTELNSLITSGVPIEEFKFVGTMIVQSRGTYDNTVKSAFRSIDTGIDYVDWRGEVIGRNGVGTTVTNHNDTAGRDEDNSHSATAISYDNSETTLISDNVQDVIDELHHNITGETSDRIYGDESLATEIDNEVSDRIVGDESLATEIDNIDQSKWSGDTYGISYDNGNVGIGIVSNQNYKLHTSGNTLIDGDLTINGDIYQSGTHYETHIEQLYTKKDLIITREDATTPIDTLSGLQVTKYDGTNDLFFGTDSDGYFKIGEVGDLQILATREDTPQDSGVTFWNDSSKRLETSSNLIFGNNLSITGNTYIQGDLDVSGNISGTTFYGDGSELTGIDISKWEVTGNTLTPKTELSTLVDNTYSQKIQTPVGMTGGSVGGFTNYYNIDFNNGGIVKIGMGTAAYPNTNIGSFTNAIDGGKYKFIIKQNTGGSAILNFVDSYYIGTDVDYPKVADETFEFEFVYYESVGKLINVNYYNNFWDTMTTGSTTYLQIRNPKPLYLEENIKLEESGQIIFTRDYDNYYLYTTNGNYCNYIDITNTGIDNEIKQAIIDFNDYYNFSSTYWDVDIDSAGYYGIWWNDYTGYVAATETGIWIWLTLEGVTYRAKFFGIDYQDNSTHNLFFILYDDYGDPIYPTITNTTNITVELLDVQDTKIVGLKTLDPTGDFETSVRDVRRHIDSENVHITKKTNILDILSNGEVLGLESDELTGVPITWQDDSVNNLIKPYDITRDVEVTNDLYLGDFDGDVNNTRLRGLWGDSLLIGDSSNTYNVLMFPNKGGEIWWDVGDDGNGDWSLGFYLIGNDFTFGNYSGGKIAIRPQGDIDLGKTTDPFDHVHANTYYGDGSNLTGIEGSKWSGTTNIYRETGNVSIGTDTALKTLHVSGDTLIDGQIQITGGIPGEGKILTSDSGGTATWELPSGEATIKGTLGETVSTGEIVYQKLDDSKWYLATAITGATYNLSVCLEGGDLNDEGEFSRYAKISDLSGLPDSKEVYLSQTVAGQVTDEVYETGIVIYIGTTDGTTILNVAIGMVGYDTDAEKEGQIDFTNDITTDTTLNDRTTSSFKTLVINSTSLVTLTVSGGTFERGDWFNVLLVNNGGVAIVVDDSGTQTISTNNYLYDEDSMCQVICFKDDVGDEKFIVIGSVPQ